MLPLDVRSGHLLLLLLLLYGFLINYPSEPHTMSSAGGRLGLN